MKKKLIAALATKFSGVDAKDLGRIADNLLRNKTIETDEDVNSAVEEVTFTDILKSYGDSRAAEATKTAVSNYEKKHGLKDGKPTEQNDEDPDGEDDPNKGNGQKSIAKKPTKSNDAESELMALLKKMSDKLDEQAKEIAGMKKGEVTKTRKARVADVLKDLSDIQKKAYLRIPVDDLSDDEFNSLIGEMTEEAGELARDNKAEKGLFGIPLGGEHHGDGANGSGKAASEAELNAVMEGFNV